MKQQNNINIIITLQKRIFMGAECVKSISKPTLSNHQKLIGSLQNDLRHCSEHLQFTMTIQHLRLTNMTNKVKQIRFSLESQIQIVYTLSQFSIHENLIKSQKIHKVQFSLPANRIDSKKLIIEIRGFNNEVIENLKLSLSQLCTGPVHHDHLLPQLKARLMFDLHLYQNINVLAKCSNMRISLAENSQFELQNISYRFGITTQIDEKTYTSLEGFYIPDHYTYQNRDVSFSLPNNFLKQSIFKIEIIQNEKIVATQFKLQEEENQKIIHSLFIPYRKIENYQIFTSIRRKEMDYVRKNISFDQILKYQGKDIGKIYFVFQVESSTVYTQQMQCLIFSELGVSSVSPTLNSNDGLITQLKQIYKSVKKISRSLGPTETKSELIRNIDQIYLKFQKSNQEIFTSQRQLYEKQITLIKLLNQLSTFFSAGQDILNQRLWRTINYIIHKPQLSSRYLVLLNHSQQLNIRKEVYFKYYKFLISVIEKIIVCTDIGITFHQLKCIQKFIAFAYFRFPWIQDKIINAWTRKQDPHISQEKLIQLGANAGCKSPSKSTVYDWQINIYRKIQSQKEFKQLLNGLENTSRKYQQWDQVLFNRDDEDLFYGLYLQIWKEAQISLKNTHSKHNKILWQYFPNYGQLLGCFLGQMNNNNINQLSTLFKECSNKLVLNQKLLDTFVVQLFPKTHLFETLAVFKCLGLLESYFEVLATQNKKLPHDFHFDYFYTGIKSILEQNHSYLVVKTLLILYKYYDIFTQDLKRTLNEFLLSQIFYPLFLHWCINVRKIFYHLLYYKILQRKVSNPQEESNSNTLRSPFSNKKQNKSILSTQVTPIKNIPKNLAYSKIKNSFSEQFVLNRKLNLNLRTIQNHCNQKRKYEMSLKKQNKIPLQKMQYHQKMKIKIQQKKKKRQLQNQRLISQLEQIQSKISQDDCGKNKNSSFMIRKKSLFTQNVDFQFYKIRKMSVADQVLYQKIDQKYHQYCLIAIKEYQETKKVDNSSLQVQKLAKLVQGDIDC